MLEEGEACSFCLHKVIRFLIIGQELGAEIYS